MKIKQLEDYYDGDESWLENVAWARQYWTGSDLQNQLLAKVNNDVDLAVMIYAKIGDDCLEWLETRIPALSSRKPINCLATPKHMRRLREALMRID
jgi:uncharacterized protein (DUF2384 family)